MQNAPLNPPLASADCKIIPLSALQHYAFCPRQCALIHNEQVWAENFLTAQGQMLHERVDSGEPETQKGIRYERTVHVSAEKLGISGILDLVECDLATGNLKPVEYKRGKPKISPMDKIQLCAQGLCLEEMTGREVKEGALWYMQTRHREVIPFDETLRAETLKTIQAVKFLLSNANMPSPIFDKRCKACSLVEFCQPELVGKDKSAMYIKNIYEESK